MNTTTMNTQSTQKTVSPFKSERAAKMAMTKAEKAYETSRDAVNALRWEYREGGMLWDDFIAREKLLEAAKEAAAAYAQAVYAQAKSQGFWVKSWHFGPNPTRDLIAANID